MACVNIEEILHKFESFTQKPVNFLTVQSGIKEDVKNLVKSVYDHTKAAEQTNKKTKRSALSKLIVQDFDEEQIWQQIELQNSECWDQLVWEVANCVSSKSDLNFPVTVIEPSQDESMNEEVDNLQSDEENELSETKESEKPSKKSKMSKKPNKETKQSTHKVRPSIVDDKFFKLQEMENFLLNEEKKEGKKVKSADSDSDEGSVDLFEDIDDEGSGDEDNAMYTDFFGEQEGEQQDFDHDYDDDQEDDNMDDDDDLNDDRMDDEHLNGDDDEEFEVEEDPTKLEKKEKKVTFANVSSNDDYDSSEDEQQVDNGKLDKNEKKSDFELRQQRLQDTITRLEEKQLKDAPWQLKGEVDATKRPQNSLLQEVVDFDLTSRPAPIITEQTTVTLEDIITRRIKDKAWDDVIRKEKPVEDQLSFRKTEIIDQSKSKMSLAQVYEAEYLKQKQALSGEVEEEKEPESHTQIKDAMNKLFSKLDALCNYHYTPKAPQAEVKIVSNTPAISMEEVAPVATSDATLLAPEEVKKKRRGDLMSKEERTQTDKNRERRKKKKLQRKKGQVTKVTDSRNTKKGVEANDKSLKTSKAFFQQLNDNSTSLIKAKNKRNVKNKGQ